MVKESFQQIPNCVVGGLVAIRCFKNKKKKNNYSFCTARKYVESRFVKKSIFYVENKKKNAPVVYY